MNKVLHIPSHFLPVGENVTKKVPTGEKKAGFFGGEKEVTKKVQEWQQTGYSDCAIDAERLSNDIANAIEKLNQDGYEVITVNSITSADYGYNYKTTGSGHNGDSGYGYGYGFSYTKGVTIIAKKIA